MPITPSARAKLFKCVGSSNQPPADDKLVVTVQFNPTTLSYAIQNTLKPPTPNAKPAQYVAQATAKLEFDLVFDSTHNGQDVRHETSRIKKFLIAGEHATPKAAAPPVVVFLWGAFSFRGFIESMRESMDFFSADGVPLRSSVKLSMTAENADAIFTKEKFEGKSGVDPASVKIIAWPPVRPSGIGGDDGSPDAGRAIGAMNGLENLRIPELAEVAVTSDDVKIKDAAAFSSGGADETPGFGGLADALGGVPLNLGGSGGGFGGSASAGISASSGAFAGLGASRTQTSLSLDTSDLLARAITNNVSNDFSIGGRAVTTASSGLTTDVGATARIRFD
jgi:hypothetical protein